MAGWGAISLGYKLDESLILIEGNQFKIRLLITNKVKIYLTST